MQQQYLEIENIKIAYLEKNSKAENIVFFIHGNSCSSRMWKPQFDTELFSHYRLIAFDLPAHGQSSPGDNPGEQYGYFGLGRIMAKAVTLIAAGKSYVLAGFSLGTNIIAEMLRYAVQPAGIVLAGACITGENYTTDKILVTDPASLLFLRDEVSEAALDESMQQLFVIWDPELFGRVKEDFFAVRLPFRSTLLQAAMEGKHSDEATALQEQNIPVCVIFGSNDNIVNIHYLDEAPFPLWRNTIHQVQGAGHFANIEQPEIFNLLLQEYATERFAHNNHM